MKSEEKKNNPPAIGGTKFIAPGLVISTGSLRETAVVNSDKSADVPAKRIIIKDSQDIDLMI